MNSLKELKTVSSKDHFVTLEKSKSRSKSPEIQNPKYLQKVESKIKDLIRHDKELERNRKFEKGRDSKESKESKEYNGSSSNPEYRNDRSKANETTKRNQKSDNYIKKSTFFSDEKTQNQQKLTTFMVESQSFGETDKHSNSAYPKMAVESEASSVSEFSAFEVGNYGAESIYSRNFKEVGKISRKKRKDIDDIQF